jgi:hypothetical protein
MRLVVAALAALLVTPAQSATFYYVGGVYDFANDQNQSPSFITARMFIDETRLPAGQGLAGLSFSITPEEDGAGPDYFNFRAQQNTGVETYDTNYNPGYGQVTFTAAGTPGSWRIDEGDTPGFSGSRFAGENGDGSNGFTGARPPSFDPTAFLTERGYRPGTRAFDRQRDSHVWTNGYASQTGGRWYTDALDYAAAIARRTAEAMERGVSNIWKIPSCRVADAAFTAEDFAPPIPA